MQSASATLRTRRSSATARTGSTNGVPNHESVREKRKKVDEVKGGIKIFNAGSGGEQAIDGVNKEGLRVYRRRRGSLVENALVSDRSKRRSCRNDDTGFLARSGVSPPRSAIAYQNYTDLDDDKIGRCEKEEENAAIEGNDDETISDVESASEEKMETEGNEIQIEEARESFVDKEMMDLGEEKREDEAKKVHEIPIAKKPDPRLIHNHSSRQLESEEKRSSLGTHNRMRGIVDLVMWRDVPKSAFIFGSGTFFLISSSYVRDLNFSLISATSYVGLVYLALVFVYRSILLRGGGIASGAEIFEQNVMVGEKEALWFIRIILPYINETLLKAGAVFSGDPATTMKVAVLLFAIARFGSSINIWTLTKIGFFGLFTVPKLCSSYSVQLAKYGLFWQERLRDGWESCTHKKAVAAAAFTLVWNLSSTVARIWAVFMLVVAVKYYQKKHTDGEEEYTWRQAADTVVHVGEADSSQKPSTWH